jgi:hypothetical protein
MKNLNYLKKKIIIIQKKFQINIHKVLLIVFKEEGTLASFIIEP